MSRRTSTEKKVNYADEESDEEEFVEPSSSSNNKKKRQSSAMSAPASNSSSGRKKSSSTKAPPAKRVKKEPAEASGSDDSDESSDEDSKATIKNKKSIAKAKPKSKAATKKKSSSQTKASAKSSAKAKPKVKKETASSSAPNVKALSSLERLEEARRAYKWWEAEELPNGLMWRKLEHPGVLFPPPYVRHGVPLLYDGQEVELTDEQEEICSFYAAMPDDGPQLGDPKTRKVFQSNFMACLKEVLVSGHVVKRFDKCDFSRIAAHLDKQRSLKKAASLEEKAQGKAVKDELVLRYGYALIDGRMEKVSVLSCYAMLYFHV